MNCSICGKEMQQTRQGSVLERLGPAYSCPDERRETHFGFPPDALDYYIVRRKAQALLGGLHNYWPGILLSDPWEKIEEALSGYCGAMTLLHIAATLRREGITAEQITKEWIAEAANFSR